MANSDISKELSEHFSESVTAILLFNSSSQAIVETYISPDASGADYYPEVSSKLLEMQRLVREWRLSGNLYFAGDFIEKILLASKVIADVKPDIETIFTRLLKKYDDDLRQELIDKLSYVVPAIDNTHVGVGSYASDLSDWGIKAQKLHEEIASIISVIQEKEREIEVDIQIINNHIDDLNKTISDDRKAIAKARAAKKKGIVETIFGAIFAPITGGASLILLGIGVSSIAEAEKKISSLENDIRGSQSKIAKDQGKISSDKWLVASLKLILLGVSTVMDDYKDISAAIDKLQVTTLALRDEIQDVVEKISKAQDTQAIILEQVWFEAACTEWQKIRELSEDLSDARVDSEYKKL